MTKETIRPGDLVMVVRPTVCCSKNNSIGKIFSVNKIESGFFGCIYCGSINYYEKVALTDEQHGGCVSRLKKLNPPAKQETTEKEKEMV